MTIGPNSLAMSDHQMIIYDAMIIDVMSNHQKRMDDHFRLDQRMIRNDVGMIAHDHAGSFCMSAHLFDPTCNTIARIWRNKRSGRGDVDASLGLAHRHRRTMMHHQSTNPPFVSAQQWLIDFLADGPQPATEILTAAASLGYSERTLKRAKAALAIFSTRRGFGKGAYSLWVLPDELPQPAAREPTPPVIPRARPTTWDTTRRAVWYRDGGCCDVCARDLALEGDYHCGHIIDHAVGGGDALENLVVQCPRCNLAKPRTIATRAEYTQWRVAFAATLRPETTAATVTIYEFVYEDPQ